ncbi:LysR family transcriptional regulator [Achromobacter sp. Marseille-Q0513]|uniref:LysR family transcriptional regulator n=1 Tax=Achromobacter sp. Marseille-Q0513 TaxID=2829161 RepID=UPI001BA2055F|nr:LysR family transcriptional regulator [Achromobacter sp. Marseille-Q0513]MBR8652963.1 LysR family transcriptional regulator [Achromobacter sp. Marseille-Q0513]
MLKHWPPLNVLRGFEAAARLGSFHKAAEELHVTQSAISQQVRSLEAYLGQPVFFRQGRAVSLTDAGWDLLGTTQAMLRQLAAGIRRLDQYRKPNQLIVNASPAFARHWLMPRLESFRAARPEADLWLYTSDAPPDMATQTVDIALRDDLAPQADCAFRVLVEDRLYPACHPRLLAPGAGAPATLHGEREMDWSHWETQGGADVGQRAQGMNFSDPGLLLDAAHEGLGMALVSALLARRWRDEGALAAMTEQTVRGPNWAWLVHRDSQDDPLARAFCGWLCAALGVPEASASGG